MSENAPTIDGDAIQSNGPSHKRILVLLCLVVLIAACISAVFMPYRFTIGILVGGLGSLLNYFWLKWSFSAMFAKAVLGEKRRFLSARFILRYVFFGAVLFLIYGTGIVPVTAVIFGLASFGLAVFAEGLLKIIIRERV